MTDRLALPVAPPPEALAAFFGPEGPLARTLGGYEERPQQAALAGEIAATVATGGKLVAEAGTGVGKTIAYLVAALQSGLKIVVSTGTKNLQEQILKKDLPILEAATGHDFDVVLLKGRNNYLCEARFVRLTRQLTLPGVAATLLDRYLLDRVTTWRQETETGDRAELAALPDSSQLWRELTVTSEQCPGRRCAEFERCWVTRARRRAQECELLIVNHHLYFADAALRRRIPDGSVGILPRHDVVVFDEAHEVDEIAAQYFGYLISERRVQDLCGDLRRAVAADAALRDGLEPQLRALERDCRALMEALPFGDGRRRLRRAQISASAVGRYESMEDGLGRLEALLATIEVDDAPTLRRRTAELAAELAFVLFQPARRSTLAEVELVLERDPLDQRPVSSEPEDRRIPFVRFTESSSRHRAIVGRPLDIAPVAAECLADQIAIFTSATLALGRDFSHFKRRLGLTDVRELLVTSPFDFPGQTRLYLPDDLPEVEDSEFSGAAAERAAELITAAGGGAFVLCTSNRMVEIMAGRLRQRTPLTVLTQGHAPRTHLIERFCADGDAILVATMSFWRGVDVPGMALRLVIIDRLPFASPGDPIVEARIEYLRHIGLSPFKVYQLPQAALLLRQGFGRLIRSRSDRGMVAILDGRISKKGYGKLLQRCLPSCPVLTQKEEALAYLDAIHSV